MGHIADLQRISLQVPCSAHNPRAGFFSQFLLPDFLVTKKSFNRFFRGIKTKLSLSFLPHLFAQAFHVGVLSSRMRVWLRVICPPFHESFADVLSNSLRLKEKIEATGLLPLDGDSTRRRSPADVESF